jgi:hypothetical protein
MMETGTENYSGVDSAYVYFQILPFRAQMGRMAVEWNRRRKR